MKKHSAQSVGEIINRAIAATGNRDEYYRQQVCFLWAEVVGPEFNRHTIRRYIDGDVLHVYMTSAVMKNELSFCRGALVEKLNTLAGKDVVRDIMIH